MCFLHSWAGGDYRPTPHQLVGPSVGNPPGLEWLASCISYRQEMGPMERVEMMYRGVRETERGRIAFVILVHMLYVARMAHVLGERGGK